MSNQILITQKPFWHRLLVFIWERFPPGESVLPLFFFGLSIQIFAQGSWSAKLAIVMLLIHLLFFFKLRVFDEIKDEEFDRVHNPQRPLIRGLVKTPELKKLIWFLIGLELILFAIFFREKILFFFAPVMYSLLMYREFFIGPWLRRYLTLYAITHTWVVGLLSWSWFQVLRESPLQDSIYYLLSYWMIFNLFEFARKTFSIDEEKPHVDSYSKVWGFSGAILLSLFTALSGMILLFPNPRFWEWLPYLVTLLGFFVGVSCLVIFLNFKKQLTRSYMKFWRTVAGFYLFIFLVIISLT